MLAVETLYTTTLDSPIGTLRLLSDGEFLTGLYMGDVPVRADWLADASVFAEPIAQLQAYFVGELQEFSLRTRPVGTPFQQHVWAELEQIPYGTTISYAELARRVGNPLAARAVGTANGKNPLSILIPCHRVIAAGNQLGGYGGGLWRKEWLLRHEGAWK